jgi:hypothetical protein
MPEHTNPVEHYLNVITTDYQLIDRSNGTEISFEDRRKALLDAYTSGAMDSVECEEMPPPEGQKRGVSGFKNFCLLFSRFVNHARYDYNKIKFYIIVFLAMSAMHLAAFFRLGDDDDIQSVQDRCGFFFFWTISMLMIFSKAGISSFPIERGLFFREQANGIYSPVSFLLAKLTLDIPLGEL